MTVYATADRAHLSGGTSGDPIYRTVSQILRRVAVGGTLLDVGCGGGALRAFVQEQFERYAGADAVRYDAFPNEHEFHVIDLDSGRVPLADGFADVVTAVEVIEHLENPRQFARELFRLAKPGGWVVITTPNQLSLLSKLTLVVKNQFTAFQERPGLYPAHLTALLEIDLRRIATEVGLTEVKVVFTCSGRFPGVSRGYPRWLCGLFPRALSDNVMLIARKPVSGGEAAR